MSGRRRRSESLWDTRDDAVPPVDISGNIPLPSREDSPPKWSNAEASDVLISDDISGQFSWEPTQGDGSMPKYDEIGRDKSRMQMDADFDERDYQYNARPWDDNRDMTYRERDRGVSGIGNMSKDRDQSRSRSRSPKQSRDDTRSRSRSRSRSPRRSRDKGRAERYTRPQYSRHEDNRNSAEAIRNRFPDDYDRGNQDRRHQSRRNSGVPCKFFAIGKCSRSDCKFSHDVPESGGYNGRSNDNTRDPNSGNRHRASNGRQLRDDSGSKPNNNFEDKKSWGGPSWDDVESGGFEERSGVFPRQTLDEGILRRDHPPPHDASGSAAITNSKHNSDYKKRPWDEANALESPDKYHSFNEGKKPPEAAEIGVAEVNATIPDSQRVPQVSSLLTSAPQTSLAGQILQAYSDPNLTSSLGLLPSHTIPASSCPPTGPMPVEQKTGVGSKEQYESGKIIEGNNPVKTGATGGPEGNERRVAEDRKHKQESVNHGNYEARGKVEDANISSDEKAMRLFKVALVDFVKEILKPTWKEGKMSRDAHKTIVKKVVDKVTGSIQGVQIPRTQERVDQYLAFSKSKITKLIEAYVERSLKA